ncbi:TetR/AcrR family transcriptional regulator C-terminal domain-containing protein [Streptomyces sp. H28]|uniref:TetR/AcrR family transcriptional regulator n=1 Tax=Streptomyces sp. H28 TaxID=2775865 RepID=UPI0017856E66|nr:TetR/AcrR family transcriptional regulator [Streptomyces sp. H28]MBD9733672.1 TetR/AcrR family transcriptional regulator C-terminal domain-containing protein [Streptomyces sp. H28]
MAKRVVPEEKRRRRRPTRSGQVLSEALIVDAALRLLREHGSSGLTARRLGLALDCDPSTLYRYFRGMDDLTLALGDALMGRALRGWRPTGEWRADLRAVGLRIHEAYVSHPQAAVLTASRVSGRANELAADEAVLDVLRSAGFPPAETVRIYHAFIDTTLGFAALDAASLALPGPARRADEEMWHSTYARLPASTHPRIAEVAPLLAARMVTSAYPTALDMLLDSAAARLGPPGGQGGPSRAADRPVSGPGRTADAVRGGAPGPPSR